MTSMTRVHTAAVTSLTRHETAGCYCSVVMGTTNDTLMTSLPPLSALISGMPAFVDIQVYSV